MLAGTDLQFVRSGVTLVDGVNHVAGFVSAAPRTEPITYQEPMPIHWTVSGDFGSVDAGTSSHNVYITQREPITNPDDGQTYPIYFTLVHWTTHVANGSGLDAQLIDRLEGDLKDLRIYRRDFDPVTGAINPRQALLQYWNDVSPGKPLSVLFEDLGPVFRCPMIFGTEGLLATADGRCGAWARFMVHALGIHGVSSDHLHLAVGSTGCVAASETCLMLVSRWRFEGKGA
jgi:hypothetical protein